MNRRNFLITGVSALAMPISAEAFGMNETPIDRLRALAEIEQRAGARARQMTNRHGIFPGASFEVIAKPYEYRAVLDEALNLGTDVCMPVRIMAVYENGQPVDSIRIWKTQNGNSIDFYRGPGHERYIEYDPTGFGFTRLKVSAGERGRPVIVLYRVMTAMSCAEAARLNA